MTDIADIANPVPRPGIAQDHGPYAAASARVFEPGQEPAKVNAAPCTIAPAAKDI